MASSPEKNSREEYFPVGSTVQCVTCLGETIEGEVVAFDRATKLLALKTSRPAPNSKKSRVQLQLVNVNLVRDVNVTSETPPPASSMQVVVPNFNYAKITRRAVEEATRKRRSICADHVSSEGQKLFVTIRKTIDDVQWRDGQNIVVLSAVMVLPPYKSDNVEIHLNEEDRQREKVTRAQAQNAADHVKKIIDQFWLKQDETPSGGSSSNETKRNSSEPPQAIESQRSPSR